jgi:hypothetical protein
MKHNTIFYAAVLLLTNLACKDHPSVYENCCGTEPTTDAFSITVPYTDVNGNLIDSTLKTGVYIPNVFIIDNSGDNNWLNVFSNETVTQVKSVIFSDESGNLLFSKQNVLPNDPAAGGWNGLKSDGSFYQGSFNYVAVVEFIDGQQKTYEGKSCAYHCNDDGFPTGNLPKYAFPSQHNGSGGLDTSLAKSDYCF